MIEKELFSHGASWTYLQRELTVLADIASVQRAHTTMFLQLEVKLDRLLDKVEALKNQIAERGGPMPPAGPRGHGFHDAKGGNRGLTKRTRVMSHRQEAKEVIGNEIDLNYDDPKPA